MANGRKREDWTRSFGNILRTVAEAHPHWELVEALGADSAEGGSEVYYIQDVKKRKVTVWLEQQGDEFINIRSTSMDRTGEIRALNKKMHKLENDVRVKDLAFSNESSRVKELMDEIKRLNAIINKMIGDEDEI